MHVRPVTYVSAQLWNQLFSLSSKNRQLELTTFCFGYPLSPCLSGESILNSRYQPRDVRASPELAVGAVSRAVSLFSRRVFWPNSARAGLDKHLDHVLS